MEPIQTVKDQKEITTCAIDIIKAVKKRTGKSLEPRDRLALQLLTPRNSALVHKNNQRSLGCRQISFNILTDDIGKGSHCLIPEGIHVYQKDRGWWNDQYGIGKFLWNLYLKETPDEGINRILERLFKFKMRGIFGQKAKVVVDSRHRTIAANLDEGLKLLIHRETGQVETTLRRMIKADAIYLPKDIGLNTGISDHGKIVLLFGKSKRFGVSFTVSRI